MGHATAADMQGIFDDVARVARGLLFGVIHFQLVVVGGVAELSAAGTAIAPTATAVPLFEIVAQHFVPLLPTVAQFTAVANGIKQRGQSEERGRDFEKDHAVEPHPSPGFARRSCGAFGRRLRVRESIELDEDEGGKGEEEDGKGGVKNHSADVWLVVVQCCAMSALPHCTVNSTTEQPLF